MFAWWQKKQQQKQIKSGSVFPAMKYNLSVSVLC